MSESIRFNPDEITTRWAAQMLEYRGSITRSPERTTIEVTDHDPDILAEFRHIVGCGTVAGPLWRGREQKPFWRWRASAAGDVEQVISRLRPYLPDAIIAKVT